MHLITPKAIVETYFVQQKLLVTKIPVGFVVLVDGLHDASVDDVGAAVMAGTEKYIKRRAI